jgi:hypothetical protein
MKNFMDRIATDATFRSDIVRGLGWFCAGVGTAAILMLIAVA